MLKKVIEMANDELKVAWELGRKWLIKNEEVTRTNKTQSGIEFNAKLFGAGLHRIESIEKEMKRRGLT